MKLERNIVQQLVAWKMKKKRKPLILHGARQIGKTWIMQTFGKRYFEHTAYFNFDETTELKQEFEKTKDIKRLLGQLSLYTSSPIIPDKTLIVLDEIQECNAALNCLKYFCENAPEYHVITAGSLLGVSLAKGNSFPVGKVDFMKMFPVTFEEFLIAAAPDLFTFVEKITDLTEIPLIVFNRMTEEFRKYQITGGMPEVIANFLNNGGTGQVETDLQAILNAYALDFSKHAENKEIPKITAIWNSLPSQLARENRKFIYRLVKSGARAREYEDALLWLEHAGLVHRIFANTKPCLPMSGYDDLSAFKLYASDIGLLRRLAKLPAEVILSGNPLYVEFKGAMTENYILQSLSAQFDAPLRYWTSEGKAEVDFLLQNSTGIIPVEVKSAHSITGKSLTVYDSLFSPALRIRFSLNNLKKNGNLINIPVFLADWTKKLLEIIDK
ncbi:MAG: ATP-binding protein [Prevotellaceae bacterium]|jgi:predicted AAA+ superfamily ATPase|nr:ATP-binding protein [Prevotellaceae bacterium]